MLQTESGAWLLTSPHQAAKPEGRGAHPKIQHRLPWLCYAILLFSVSNSVKLCIFGKYWLLCITDFFHQAYLSLSDSVRMIKDLSFEIGYFCTEKKKNRSILRGLWLTGMKLLLYPVLYMSRVAELRITFEKCWSDLGLMFDSWKWLELPMTLYASALHLQSSLEVISNDNQWK